MKKILSLSSLNLGAGKGFVKMAAMLSAVWTYFMFNFPAATTSLQNFKQISMCLVLDLEESFPIELIAGIVHDQLKLV